VTDHDSPTHLAPEALADLDEDLLDPGAAAAARAHLETCARCRGDLAGLAGVRDLLAGGGQAEPMPPGVAARLDQALAAEATGAAESPAPVEGAGTRTVVPLHTERTGPRGMRVLQAAAVIVLLLAGGALGVSALHGTGGGDSAGTDSAAGSAAAPKAAEGGFPVTASGHDWDATSLAAAAPALAAGTFGPSYESTMRAAAPPGPAASPSPSSSAGAGSDSAGGSAGALVNAPAGRLSGGRALADCITALTGRAVTPLAVDLARFKGQPAAVILLPPLTGGRDKVDVWVVGASCAADDDKTLYWASVPRS
jgi:hypothetical protein